MRGNEHLRQRHVVDVDDGGELALGADLADQPHDLARGLGIEARGRLVDQQQVRLLLQRARDADALALAAGKRIGALVDMLGQARRDRAAAKALVDIGLRKAPRRTSARTARSRAGPDSTFSITVSRSTSANSWKIMPMRRRALRKLPRATAPVSSRSLQKNPAGGRLDQPVDAADQRRFAGARRADQADDLAGRHREGDAAQRHVAGRDSAWSARSMRSTAADASRSLAGVADAHRLVDLAHHLPVLLVGDRQEFLAPAARMLLEFLQQLASPPRGR